ncbi:MAG TPA: 2-dehydropantoate 2-reductase [Alphaproteobacteria bacterium]|nr:2-dehydropantoate 2-reductase [Alphaproteobacteria bacterium]
MKIAVMGTGGVGGYFGARLAGAGSEVAFIARGAHLDAIRAEGLRVTSAKGDVIIKPATASDDPAEIGPVDIVLFATKLWAVEASGAACKPLLRTDGPTGPTGVVSLQNGVDAEARLADVLGPAHVVGGVAAIAAVIAEPGRIQHNGTMAAIEFGELDGSVSPRVEALRAACEAAGFGAAIAPDINYSIWRKMALLASFSGITALTRKPLGEIRGDRELRAMLDAAVGEVFAVAAAQGIAVDEAMREVVARMIENLPDAMTSSMAEDLTRGNRLELPWLSGAIVRLGAAAGVPTPTHAHIVEALTPHQEGAATT